MRLIAVTGLSRKRREGARTLPPLVGLNAAIAAYVDRIGRFALARGPFAEAAAMAPPAAGNRHRRLKSGKRTAQFLRKVLSWRWTGATRECDTSTVTFR